MNVPSTLTIVSTIALTPLDPITVIVRLGTHKLPMDTPVKVHVYITEYSSTLDIAIASMQSH